MILVFISLCVFCACVLGLAFLQGVETKKANASVFTHTEEVRMKKGVAVSDTFLDGKKGYLFETERNGSSVVFGEGFSGKFSIESSPIAETAGETTFESLRFDFVSPSSNLAFALTVMPSNENVLLRLNFSNFYFRRRIFLPPILFSFSLNRIPFLKYLFSFFLSLS